MLYDQGMPIRLNEEFYRTIITLAMIYGTECWPIKKQYMYKIDIARWDYWSGCVVKLERVKLEMSDFENIYG